MEKLILRRITWPDIKGTLTEVTELCSQHCTNKKDKGALLKVFQRLERCHNLARHGNETSAQEDAADVVELRVFKGW